MKVKYVDENNTIWKTDSKNFNDKKAIKIFKCKDSDLYIVVNGDNKSYHDLASLVYEAFICSDSKIYYYDMEDKDVLKIYKTAKKTMENINKIEKNNLTNVILGFDYTSDVCSVTNKEVESYSNLFNMRIEVYNSEENRSFNYFLTLDNLFNLQVRHKELPEKDLEYIESYRKELENLTDLEVNDVIIKEKSKVKKK